jgi:hypothetical protein
MIDASEANLAATTDKTIIISGHGKPVSNRAELRAFRDMLVGIRENVAKLKHKAGPVMKLLRPSRPLPSTLFGVISLSILASSHVLFTMGYERAFSLVSALSLGVSHVRETSLTSVSGGWELGRELHLLRWFHPANSERPRSYYSLIRATRGLRSQAWNAVNRQTQSGEDACLAGTLKLGLLNPERFLQRSQSNAIGDRLLPIMHLPQPGPNFQPDRFRGQSRDRWPRHPALVEQFAKCAPPCRPA